MFPDRLICDVTGLVVFIGRYERERKLYNDGSAGNGFWMHRWVHLKDGKSAEIENVLLIRIITFQILKTTHSHNQFMHHIYFHMIPGYFGQESYLMFQEHVILRSFCFQVC